MATDSVSELRSVIQTTANVAEETRARHMLEPHPRSEAAAELVEEESFALGSDKRPVLDCYTGAFLRLTVAGDELRSVQRLMNDPLPVFGPAALLRTVLEVSARAWWAFEPDIGVRRRVIRGYVDRITSLIESSRIRVGEATGEAEEIQTTSMERLAEVIDGAEAHGFAVRLTKRGALMSVADEPAPRHAKLIRQQLGGAGEASYRVLSGLAHGVLFAVVWRTKPVEGGKFEGGELRTPVPEFTDLLLDVATALSSYRDAVDRQLRLFGWDRTEWEACRVEVNRVMKRLFHGAVHI